MKGISEIEQKRAEIAKLCEQYAVLALYLFGSAATGGWDRDKSDYDFAVRFGPAPQGIGAFDQYLGLKEGLAKLLGRNVDLVELDAIDNPFFQRHLERTRLEVFAA